METRCFRRILAARTKLNMNCYSSGKGRYTPLYGFDQALVDSTAAMVATYLGAYQARRGNASWRVLGVRDCGANRCLGGRPQSEIRFRPVGGHRVRAVGRVGP